MDLIATLRALRRRWIVTSLLLLATLTGTAAVIFVLPWTYQAKSSVILLASQNESKPAGNNPWLTFNSAITNTAYVLSLVVTGPSVQRELPAAGAHGSYTVALSSATRGPGIFSTATASPKARAASTL